MNSNTVKITLLVDDKGTVKVKNVGKALDDMGRDATKAGAKAGKSMSDLNAQIGKTSKGADLMGKAVKGAMAYFSVKALADFEGHIVKTGMRFETTMATVKGVSRATDEEFKALTASARDMGENTEWSATQSAEALKYMSMAGFTVRQSIDALPGVLDLATAGNLELGRASDIVTDSLTAMGLGVDDLSHFSDVLISTTTRSNTNIEMMGESLKYVAPIAHSMGYEIEQVSALLGTLANAGIKASDAGTDLRQAMLRNSKAAAELGTESDDLIGTIRAARDAHWDATKVQEEWGIIASKSVLVLMEQIDKYEDLYGKLQNVDGATKQLAGTMRDTTEGAWKELRSVIESVELDIFKGQSDDLKDALRGLSGVIRDNKGNLVDGVTALTNGLVQTGKAAGTLIGYYNSLPSEVTTGVNAGIVARILTGSTPIGVAAASLFALNSAMEAVNKTTSDFFDLPTVSDVESSWGKYTKAVGNIWDVLAGKRDWNTGELLAPSDDDIRDASARVQKLRDKYLGTWGDYDAKLEEMVQDQAKREEEAARKTVKARSDASKKLTDAEEKRLKKEQKILDKELKENEAMLTKLGKVRDKDHDKAVDAAVKEYERKHKAVAKFNEEYEELITDRYTFAKRQTNAYYDNLLEDGADALKVEEARSRRLAEITEEEYRDKTLASNDFFAGAKVGWDDLTNHQQTWAETGATMIQDFADSASESLSSNLFDAIHGDMDNLSEAWDGLWDAMLQTLTDKVAEMVVVAATNQVVDMGGALLGSFGMSGMGDAAMDMLGDVGDWAVDLLTFHSGAYELKPDEFTGKLQQGEMIIPKEQSDQIRASMDAHGYGGDFFQNLADTVNMSVDPDAIGYQSLTAKALQDDFVNSLAMAGLAGVKSALGTYGMATQYGMPSAMAADYAMDAFASQGFTSLVSGFMSSAMETGFGLGTSALDFGFGTIDTMTLAKRAMNVAMMVGGLGIPGSLALAASPVLGLALDAAFDAMDVRAHESFLDAIEDNAGSWSQSLKDRSMLESYSRVYGVPMDDVMEDFMRAPTLEMQQIMAAKTVQSVRDFEKEVMDAKKRGLISSAYGRYGKAFADAAFAGQVPGVSPHDMAVTIGTDRWGFTGYENRQKALETLGLSTEDAVAAAHGYGGYGGSGLSSDGLGTQGSAYAGADSADIGAAIAMGAAAHAAASGWGGSAYSISHHGEAEGTGGGRSDGTTGGGMGAGIGAGNSPGSGSEDGHRWTGGPVSPGYMYEINERGQELFMPGVDGRILNAQETSEMLATLKQIARQGGTRSGQSSGSGQPIVVQVVLDGQVIQESMVEGMRNMSDMGMPVLNSRGVYQEL